MTSIDSFLAAHRDMLALLLPMYLVLWSVVMGRLSMLVAKVPLLAWLSGPLHVLALSPAPRSKADLIRDAVKALEESTK